MSGKLIENLYKRRFSGLDKDSGIHTQSPYRDVCFFIGPKQLLNILKGLYHLYLYNSKNSIKLLKIDSLLTGI